MPVATFMFAAFSVLTWAFLNGMMSGLPFWPFVTGTAALLFAFGLWVGNGAWKAPLIVLCAYAAMRAIMTYAADPVQEHAAFLIWVVAASALAAIRAWVPALAYFCSGATYPVMQLFGFPIEYLGLAPIIAELFAMAALISMGGGLYDRRPYTRSAADVRARSGSVLSRVSLGLAPGAR